MSKVDELRKKYNNGVLISDKQWLELKEMENIIKHLTQKSSFLKTNATLSAFSECSIEEFELLVRTNGYMYTVLMDIYAVLDFKNYGADDVFATEQEVMECIERIFTKIEELKGELAEYYSEIEGA